MVKLIKDYYKESSNATKYYNISKNVYIIAELSASHGNWISVITKQIGGVSPIFKINSDT